MLENDITAIIIGCAIEIHRQLGPGLLESTYEECLCHELRLAGLNFKKQLKLPVDYKGVKLDCGYRVDILVMDKVIVELKAVDRIIPIYEAQLLTYLKLSGCKVGLMINFNVSVLKRGIKRIVNDFDETSAASAPLR